MLRLPPGPAAWGLTLRGSFPDLFRAARQQRDQRAPGSAGLEGSAPATSVSAKRTLDGHGRTAAAAPRPLRVCQESPRPHGHPVKGWGGPAGSPQPGVCARKQPRARWLGREGPPQPQALPRGLFESHSQLPFYLAGSLAPAVYRTPY